MSLIHKLFRFGIATKLINGTLELLGSIIFLTAGKQAYLNFLFHISRNELIEDPNDLVINYVVNFFQSLNLNTQQFASMYIFIHGFLNIFLGIQLYRNKLWAFPATILILILILSYQIYRITYSHSIVLTLITIWDSILIYIIFTEYKKILPRTP